MKTFNAMLLAATLLATVPAQAATLTIPETHTFTIHLFLPTSFSTINGGGEAESTITQWHQGPVFVMRRTFTAQVQSGDSFNHAPPYPVIYNGVPDGTQFIFTVWDDTDFFTIDRHTGRLVVASIEHTIETPLPAALPLFAVGLGIVTFLARRKKTTAARPA